MLKEHEETTMMLDLQDERQAHIDERLRTNYIAWLTTVRPDGRPHSVAVWFLWDGATILIFSIPENQKIRNIRHEPRVLVALDDTKLGEDVITVEGIAELIENPDVAATLPAYIQKYGKGIKGLGTTPEGMAQQYSQGIRITPTRIH
jgi:PPOX class probable F420-dependent enzyme